MLWIRALSPISSLTPLFFSPGRRRRAARQRPNTQKNPQQRKVNFSNSDLSGVSLFSALAEGSNFSGANLSNADLESGNYEDADCELCGCSVDDNDRRRSALALLTPPRFSPALPHAHPHQNPQQNPQQNPPQNKVTNANLTGAFVTNAQFKRVKIAGSDWTDVVLRKDVQEYLCSIAEGTNPVTGVSTRESLVCP